MGDVGGPFRSLFVELPVDVLEALRRLDEASLRPGLHPAGDTCDLLARLAKHLCRTEDVRVWTNKESRRYVVCIGRRQIEIDKIDVASTYGEARVVKLVSLIAPMRQASIEVVSSYSVQIAGPPMRGTCSSCGADLDTLARTGVTGHVCFGPGDSTNHRPPS